MEKFVIEANLFPELLVKYVRERAMHGNVTVPLVEVRNTKNKELRIFGMRRLLARASSSSRGARKYCWNN